MKFTEQSYEKYKINQTTLLEIDFSRPWWHIFWIQKRDIVMILLTTTISNVLVTFFPKLIGWAIQTGSFTNLLIVISLYLADEASSWLLWGPYYMRLYVQTIESFRYSAYKHLLTIDPIYHAQQSSGVGIGKIRRTMDAYKDLLRNLLDELVPLAVALLSMLLLFLYFDPTLAIAATIGLLLLSAIFGTLAIFLTRPIERQANADDDRANHIGTESLIQANFIRATFASNQIRDRLRYSHSKVTHTYTKFLRTYRFMRGIFIFTYTICIGLITAYLIRLIHMGIMDATTALALIMTVINSTYPLLKIDKRIRETVSAHRKIMDFYNFIHNFGVQSYPVYSSDIIGPTPIIESKTPITLEINSVNLAYPRAQPIFSNLSLRLSVEQNDPQKLYGIIGPSGIGKTTLLALIGGQFKPSTGSVLINGYDIYTISDHERQQLIALQGQVASSLHGTLAYNLTFGLPYDHGYSEEQLIEILNAVGLWQLFKDKQGLKTLVGEGGATLSGGQRQRLNFANLYLRAKKYKPAIILIDEPTSSLDEISEQKVTEFISQLAQDSLTLVIAHRLKTLDNAKKITDFCLLAENNRLDFLTHDELLQKSPYYQQLVSGETMIAEPEE
jgi:ABC-type multidrug transport system fused ATPase/permease subunit